MAFSRRKANRKTAAGQATLTQPKRAVNVSLRHRLPEGRRSCAPSPRRVHKRPRLGENWCGPTPFELAAQPSWLRRTFQPSMGLSGDVSGFFVVMHLKSFARPNLRRAAPGCRRAGQTRRTTGVAFSAWRVARALIAHRRVGAMAKVCNVLEMISPRSRRQARTEAVRQHSFCRLDDPHPAWDDAGGNRLILALPRPAVGAALRVEDAKSRLQRAPLGLRLPPKLWPASNPHGSWTVPGDVRELLDLGKLVSSAVRQAGGPALGPD